ncbi:MAG: sulfatase [Candidatus Cyclobacteriaceae bacterium M3_2C_046]
MKEYALRDKLACIIFFIVFQDAIKETVMAQPKENRPNIVFILADDLGWSDLPMYGNRFNEAPNLTKLAEEGMLFTNAYAAAPVCSPTRASIQTGQYPARTGIIDFISGHWRPFEKVTVPINAPQYLPYDTYTLAEALQDNGYRTGYFGKWHLGLKTTKEAHPSRHGYDNAIAYTGGGFYNPRFEPETASKPGERLSQALTRFSIEFIKENRGQPFFLFLAHYDVHVQLDADTSLIKKYVNKNNPDDHYPGNPVYAAMIEHLDQSVAAIRQTLEELNLTNNTLLIFFSDNGGLVSRFDKKPVAVNSKLQYITIDSLKPIATSNYPLRNEKGSLYEGGVKVPMIISWPGQVPQGKVNRSLVSSVDFYPTILALAGAKSREDHTIDGLNLQEIFTRDHLIYDRAIFWHYPVYHHSVPASAVRQGDWKLIQFLDEGWQELYHLEKDVSESINLIKKHPVKGRHLKKLLDDWRQQVNAPDVKPNPDFDPDKRHQWGTHPSKR